MMRAAIGVDFGGSSAKLGLVTQEGRVVARASFETGASKTKAQILRELVFQCRSLLACARKFGYRFQGVGIGVPGPVDPPRGWVYFCPNLPGWKNTPLKRLLEKKLSAPIYLDNDAGAMALGEFLFGAGRGAKNFIALTLGTGVGGGIVFGGRLFHGPVFSAAEVGHVIVNEEGPRCGCGSRGCVETYVGSGYFVRGASARLKAGQKSVLKKWLQKGQALSPLLVARAARAGDRFSKRLWQEAGEHLGSALVGLINVLNPERVVIGGGIAQNRRELFPSIVRTIRQKAFPIAAHSVKVVPASLGIDAGIIGAAALALKDREAAF